MSECWLCLKRKLAPNPYKSFWFCSNPEHVCCSHCYYFNTFLDCPICFFNLEITKQSTDFVYRRNFAERVWEPRYTYHFYNYGYRKVIQQLAGLLWGTVNRSAAFRFQLLHRVKKHRRQVCRKQILVLRKFNLPSELIRYVIQFV